MSVLTAQIACECYWVRSIWTGDTAGQVRAHAELDTLLAHNIIEAPAGADENWRPSVRPVGTTSKRVTCLLGHGLMTCFPLASLRHEGDRT